MREVGSGKLRGPTELAGGKHRRVCEQKVHANKIQMRDTGLSARPVKRKQG